MSRMVDCTCRSCGKLFSYAYSGVRKGRGKFCSRKCTGVANRGKHDRATTPAQRYERFVVRRGPDECWAWKGFKHKGYGRIRVTGPVGGRAIGAHRVSYEMANGPIPDGMTVLHRCDNPECTNPAHLFLGTNADNNRDRDAKGRQARGERSGRAVLTDAAVREIRRLDGAVKDIAQRFQCAPETIRAVRSGRTWRHVALIAAAVFTVERPVAIDGDTFKAADGTRVRIWGVDSPEMNTPAGPPAKAAAARLINGQTLTCQPKGKSYNRIVALCLLPDGRDVANELVCSGNAKDWPKFSRGRYAECVR